MSEEKKDSEPNKAKTKKVRSHNDLEVIKMVLDDNIELKSKVLKFIRKNYSVITKAIDKNNQNS